MYQTADLMLLNQPLLTKITKTACIAWKYTLVGAVVIDRPYPAATIPNKAAKTPVPDDPLNPEFRSQIKSFIISCSPG